MPGDVARSSLSKTSRFRFCSILHGCGCGNVGERGFLIRGLVMQVTILQIHLLWFDYEACGFLHDFAKLGIWDLGDFTASSWIIFFSSVFSRSQMAVRRVCDPPSPSTMIMVEASVLVSSCQMSF